MAAGDVRRRSRDVHRRPRPGRRIGTGAQEGADARHQARKHLRRRPARRIRARFRIPDVSRQRRLRRRLSARHLDRPSADRQEADRDREEGRRRRRLSWRDRQGQRSGPFRAWLLRPRTRHQDHRAVARVDLQGPRRTSEIRARASDPGREGQGRRVAVLRRRQPSAFVFRRQGARRPGQESARDRLSAHDLADGRARQGDDDQDRLRQGRRRFDRRQEAVAGNAA